MNFGLWPVAVSLAYLATAASKSSQHILVAPLSSEQSSPPLDRLQSTSMLSVHLERHPAQQQFLERKPRGRTGADEDAGEEEKMDMDKWPKWLRVAAYVAAAVILTTSSCCIFVTCFRLHSQYRVISKDFTEEEDATFKSYVMYRFAYWFGWTPGASGYIIISLVFFSLFFGAAIYCYFVGKGMWSSLWAVFVWLLAPDAGAAERTYSGSTIGAGMSIIGLVLFALLLTLMQEGFSSYLDDIKNGRSVVMESGHILLIGITDNTMPIIPELCKAYEVSGGAKIVLLSSLLSKPDMEDKIREMEFDMLGSKIVVRQGMPHLLADLKMVSAEAARSIVIMADRDQPKEMRDAFVLRSLIGLRGKGWPINGEIVAACTLLRNKPLLEQTGGSKTNVVMLDSFVGKLMVQCSKHQGLGAVVKSAFGFDGSEFYITSVPKSLAGKNLNEAALYYPSSIICGVISSEERKCGSGRCNLLPGKEYRMHDDDEIVLLAADSSCVDAEETPCKSPTLTHLDYKSIIPAADMAKLKPEKILIMGWNDKAGYILLELDNFVAPGTEVAVLSPKPEDEREEELEMTQKRFGRKLKNISVHQVSGILGSRYMLEELKVVAEASRIFILADDCQAATSSEADTCTIAVLMQVRDLLMERNMSQASFRVALVPEILDTETEMHCEMVHASDFIDTSGLPSKVLAMIAYNPHIAPVLDEVLSEDGSMGFAIRRLQDYIQPGTETPPSISFFQVQDLAHHAGDVAVGWSIPRAGGHKELDDFGHEMFKHSACSGNVCSWEINPEDKQTEREWNGKDDKIVVLSTSHM